MTPEEFRARSCTNKVPFASRREARHRATQQMSRLGDGKVVPYSCRIDSSHWHIGHASSKSQRRKSS